MDFLTVAFMLAQASVNISTDVSGLCPVMGARLKGCPAPEYSSYRLCLNLLLVQDKTWSCVDNGGAVIKSLGSPVLGKAGVLAGSVSLASREL